VRGREEVWQGEQKPELSPSPQASHSVTFRAAMVGCTSEAGGGDVAGEDSGSCEAVTRIGRRAATEDMAATEDDDAGSSMRLRLAISSLVFMS